MRLYTAVFVSVVLRTISGVLVPYAPQDTLIISVLRFLRTKLRTIPAVWCVFLSILLQLLCVENQPRKEIAEGLENYCIFSIYYITPAPAAVQLRQDLPGFPGVEVPPIVLRIGTISERGKDCGPIQGVEVSSWPRRRCALGYSCKVLIYSKIGGRLQISSRISF